MAVDIARVKELFAAALELSGDQRAAYLDAECAGDSELRRRLEAMLRTHEDSGELLSRSPAEILADTDATQAEATAGAQPRASGTQAEPGDGAAEWLSFLEPSSTPGQLGKLGHYAIHEVIGKGGFGVVLKAFDERLHRVVAIKVLAASYAASGAARKRFIREARSAAAVKNEHVVAIHDVRADADPPYLVMEMIDGVSLQDKIDKHGSLGLKEILRIGMQTAEGLAAAHKQGLVHRDIKPANILLENGVERVKITDFGLARAVDDASVTQSGTVAGTPMYMSPEQAEGLAIDHRSDLFSLGTVLYAMCTGHPPFRASGTHAVLKRVIDGSPRPIREINNEIPEWLCDIIAKLHAKKPDDRFDTAKEVAELLGQRLADVQAGRAIGEPSRVSDPVTSARRGSPAAAAGPERPSAVLAESGDPPQAREWEAPPGVRRFLGGFAASTAFFVVFFVLCVAAAFLVSSWFEWQMSSHFILSGVIGSVATAFWAMAALAERWGKHREARQFDWGARLITIAAICVAVTAYRYLLSARMPSEGSFVATWIDPSLVATLSAKDGAPIILQRGVAASVPPGEYRFRVDKDDEGVFYRTVQIEAGKTQKLTVAERGTLAFETTDQTLRVKVDLIAWPSIQDKGKHVFAQALPVGWHVCQVVDGSGTVVWEDKKVVVGDITEIIDIEKLRRLAAQANDTGWVQLFNGRDLTGWTNPKQDLSAWRIDSGVLVGKGDEAFLRTERGPYSDFHLRMEAKYVGGTAGLVLREQSPDVAGAGYECMMENHKEGDVNTGAIAVMATKRLMGQLAAPTQVLTQRNQWFTLEIIAGGNRLRTFVDGRKAVDFVDINRDYLEGFIGLNVRGEDGELHVKKLEIKELPLQERGWIQLFNGVDLDGWTPSPRDRWNIDNGALVGAAGGKLTAHQNLGDFQCRIKAKFNSQGNGSVTLGGNADVHAGVRIGDQQAAARTGSLFLHSQSKPEMLVAWDKQLVQPDAWFDLEITMRKKKATVKVNGTITAERDMESLRAGFYPIGLQADMPGTVITVGTIEIRELHHADRFTNSLGMVFARIPKGKAWLGGGGGTVGDRAVEFKEDFFLGLHEVTQDAWEKVMGSNPSQFSRTGAQSAAVKSLTDADLKRLPVDSVSWTECEEFVHRLNLKPPQDGWVYRMPTVAEWEYACRGGPSSNRDEFGFDYYLDQSVNAAPASAMNVAASGIRRPRPVGSYAPNRLGLFDMHGNVAEWCTNPVASGQGIMGGSWDSTAGSYRAASYVGYQPKVKLPTNGLRVARVRAANSETVPGLNGLKKGKDQHP